MTTGLVEWLMSVVRSTVVSFLSGRSSTITLTESMQNPKCRILVEGIKEHFGILSLKKREYQERFLYVLRSPGKCDVR